MKRLISFLLVTIICCSMLLSAAQGAEADPDYMNKLNSYLLEQMEGKADDAIIPISVRLVSPSSEEIEEMIPIPRPDVYSAVTLEEINAYLSARRTVVEEVFSGITGAFVQNYLDENDTVRYRGRYTSTVICNVPKSKVYSLAALEEVTQIVWASKVTAYPTWIQNNPDAANKLSAPLKDYMETAADDEPVTICVDLKMPSEENMEWIVSVPKPGEDASQEEIDAYNEAYQETWKQQISIRTDTFVNHSLSGSEPVPVYYIGTDEATVICEVPVGRIMYLASRQEIVQIDLAGVLADGPPEIPPEIEKKLDSYLLEQMEGKADDEIIPISVRLVSPSSEEIEEKIPIPRPDVYSTVTLEEINTYLSARRTVVEEVFSGITGAFVQNYLDENDTVRYRGRYTSTVICNVPKSKVYSLAALEEVTQIVWASKVTAYPTWIQNNPDAANKLSAPLKDYMETAADDEPVTICVDLKMPSEEDMEWILNMPKPGEDASQEEIDAYNAAYQEAWKQQVSLRTDNFVNHTLSGSEPVPVYYIGKNEATVICEVPVNRIMYLASMQEIVQIDLAGELASEAVNYDALNQAIDEAEKLDMNDYTSASADAVSAALSDARNALESESQQAVDAAAQALNDALAALVEKHLHDYTAVVTAPTCTAAGYTTHTCDCGDSYVDDQVPAPGHSFGAWTASKAATCTDKGEETRACARCDTKETREVPALGHDYKAVVTAPTCTATGFTTHTCARCGDSYTDSPTAALGHSFSAWTASKAATCTEKGEETRACVRCDAKETRELAALGHDYKAAVTAPTCTVAGFTTHTCSRCGDKYTDSMTVALDHDWGEGVVTKEPTETETGVRTFTCTRCGEKKTESIPVKPHVHAYSDAVTAPTCTEAGFTTHTCACGDSYQDAAVPALGHSFGEWTDSKAATCTEKGEQTRVCTRCEAEETREIDALGHSFGEWAVTKAATCTAEGEESRICANCGEKETRKLDKIAHDYKDGKCTACGEADPDYKPPFRFDDVKDDKAFYFAPVYWAVDKKITKGTSEKLFSPNDGCTRAQVVTFLWRAAGEPEPTKAENPFKDVKETDYFYKAVLWAVENGITKGTSADKFSPDATCTRAQIVTFLYRAEGTPEIAKKSKPFHDVDEGQYYADAVAWAVENGVTTGKSADTFAPEATCTRGEIVTFLYRSSKE